MFFNLKPKTSNLKPNDGFTVIELIVVMGLIAILAAVVLVALNPARHFAQARNTQRTSNVAAILDAISQNMADNKGIFTCTSALPSSATTMASSGGYDVAACLVPTYISALPVDPSGGTAHYTSNSNYNTGYFVMQDSSTNRITVNAPATELGIATIQATR